MKRKQSMRAAYAEKCRKMGSYPSMRKTKLRAVSKLRAQKNRDYQMVRSFYLLQHPQCESGLGCGMAAEDIHHKRGRAGTLLTDVRFFVGVCRCCHDMIHGNPNGARELGLLAPANEWNVSLE